MKNMKPVIGITANYMYDGSGEYREGIGAPDQEWQLLADDYITSVQRAGGIPVILPVIREDVEWEVVKRLMDGVDGLLFSGGSDVDPMRFGQVTTGRTGNLIIERDEQEFLCSAISWSRRKAGLRDLPGAPADQCGVGRHAASASPRCGISVSHPADVSPAEAVPLGGGSAGFQAV